MIPSLEKEHSLEQFISLEQALTGADAVASLSQSYLKPALADEWRMLGLVERPDHRVPTAALKRDCRGVVLPTQAILMTLDSLLRAGLAVRSTLREFLGAPELGPNVGGVFVYAPHGRVSDDDDRARVRDEVEACCRLSARAGDRRQDIMRVLLDRIRLPRAEASEPRHYRFDHWSQVAMLRSAVGDELAERLVDRQRAEMTPPAERQTECLSRGGELIEAYLVELAAGLSRWLPRIRPKRAWPVVRFYLLLERARLERDRPADAFRSLCSMDARVADVLGAAGRGFVRLADWWLLQRRRLRDLAFLPGLSELVPPIPHETAAG